MWKSFVALAFKEFLHMSRNKMMLKLTAYMQILNLLLLGFIDFDARDLPTVIVDQDRSSYSRELVAKMKATQTFDVKFTTSSVQQARGHIRAGRARVAVVIPPDFHRERARRGTARILALVDGSDSVSSDQALAAIDGMSAQLQVDEAPADSGEASVRPHSMLLFNPEGRASNFMLPGLLAIILSGAYLNFSSSALVREREQGTLERLLMTPLDFGGLMLGKLVPYWIAAIVNAVLMLILMRFAFGVPIRGSIPAILVAFALFSLTILALGTYLASNAQSAMEIGPRQMQLAATMTMLSGYIFPLSSLPKFLLPIAYALPSTHMIEILRALTLRGAAAEDVWVNFLYLGVAPVVLLFLAVRRFRATIHH